jgi:iron(III) transport system permease protein
MGELGTTLLVYPSGCDTLPIRIFTLMHYGPESLVAALCVILIAVTILPLTIFAKITGRMVKIL